MLQLFTSFSRTHLCKAEPTYKHTAKARASAVVQCVPLWSLASSAGDTLPSLHGTVFHFCSLLTLCSPTFQHWNIQTSVLGLGTKDLWKCVRLRKLLSEYLQIIIKSQNCDDRVKSHTSAHTHAFYNWARLFFCLKYLKTCMRNMFVSGLSHTPSMLFFGILTIFPSRRQKS